MGIIEEESSPKFARFIHKHGEGEMELNLKSNDSFELFDIYYRFSEVQQLFHVALISKDDQYKSFRADERLIRSDGKSTYPGKNRI